MKLGIIGGTGVYECGKDFQNIKEISVSTPFGTPSEKITSATISNNKLYFLPRHGKGHRILPSELNHKANIYAMKSLGVTHLLSLSAVGSLKESMRPRDIVIVNQFFDRTKRNPLEQTFFGNGIVGHISFGDPVCPEFSELIFNAAKDSTTGSVPAITVHKGGTYINMEGPAFSTKAESEVYRIWGMDVIGMTNLAEAKLAREAGICYASAAFVTDYDCWHSDFGSVKVEDIIEHLNANKTKAYEIIKNTAESMEKIQGECSCALASLSAIVTDSKLMPEKIKEELSVIFPTLKG